MNSFMRLAFLLGLISITATIAPLAQAETQTGNQNSSESLHSETIENHEIMVDESTEDSLIVAEVEEVSDVSSDISDADSSRIPLTSRIFPCSSMQQ